MRLFYFSIAFLLFGSCSEMEVAIWKTLEAKDGSAPIERHEAAFVKIQDNYYLLGGRGIRPVSIFDSVNERWVEGSPPPIEMHHFQPVIYKDKIYIVGAFTGKWPNEVPIDSVMIYDPKLDVWKTGDEIPKDRRRGAAGAVLKGDDIFLSCGIKNGHIGDHKKWFDKYNLSTGEWTILPDAPRTRDHFNAVLAKNRIYLAAGRNTMTDESPFSRTIGEVDVFDLSKNKWSTISEELPTKRAGNAAILFRDEVLIIGGESDTQEEAHSDVEGLNIHSHSWRVLSPMLVGRHGTGAIQHENKIILASGCGKQGGEPELNSMEALIFNSAQ